MRLLSIGAIKTQLLSPKFLNYRDAWRMERPIKKPKPMLRWLSKSGFKPLKSWDGRFLNLEGD
jgi:hypothetical protein